MSEAGSLSEARLLLSRACEEQARQFWPGQRVKYGTVLGQTQDREEVAEKEKSLFCATAGHLYVTASEVQTGSAKAGQGGGGGREVG